MEILPQHISPVAKADQQNTLSPAEKQKLRKACADFEALLTQQMLATMRESSFADQGLFEKSHGEKLFQSMLDQEIAVQTATGTGTGFGNMLFEQISKGADR